MNYQLAKQLKDAGFPVQDGHNAEERWKSWVNPKNEYCNWQASDEYLYCPTLEELIEACPRLITERGHFALEYIEDGWLAGYSAGIGMFLSSEGATPTEAVARLWLALNKKV